jgi:hypothetical protein
MVVFKSHHHGRLQKSSSWSSSKIIIIVHALALAATPHLSEDVHFALVLLLLLQILSNLALRLRVACAPFCVCVRGTRNTLLSISIILDLLIIVHAYSLQNSLDQARLARISACHLDRGCFAAIGSVVPG